MSNLQFAPDEDNVTESKFSPSVVLFWLRTEMGVSSTRVATKSPNTLFGVIPLGYADHTYPLRTIVAVSASARFSVGRFIVGLTLFIAGLAAMKIPAAGVILLLLGISFLANAMSASLATTNTGGGVTKTDASIFQKSKQFREQISQRVFADQDLLRHNKTMQVQNQQLAAQQQILTAHVMGTNAQLQAQTGNK